MVCQTVSLASQIMTGKERPIIVKQKKKDFTSIFFLQRESLSAIQVSIAVEVKNVHGFVSACLH